MTSLSKLWISPMQELTELSLLMVYWWECSKEPFRIMDLIWLISTKQGSWEESMLKNNPPSLDHSLDLCKNIDSTIEVELEIKVGKRPWKWDRIPDHIIILNYTLMKEKKEWIIILEKLIILKKKMILIDK